jgi:hypothetical protein
MARGALPRCPTHPVDGVTSLLDTLVYLHQDGILSQVTIVLLSKVIGISILMNTHAKYMLKISIF